MDSNEKKISEHMNSLQQQVWFQLIIQTLIRLRNDQYKWKTSLQNVSVSYFHLHVIAVSPFQIHRHLRVELEQFFCKLIHLDCAMMALA